MSETLHYIGNNAFSNGIDNVIIPNSTIHIGQDAFKSNSITTLSLGNFLERIEHGAFENNQLESLELPESLTIADYAFRANNLSQVDISKNVEYIGSYAFDDNETSIILPNTDKPYVQSVWNGNIIGGTAVNNFRNAYTLTEKESPIADGVYVGVIGFNGEIQSTSSQSSNGLLQLNSSGSNRSQLNSFVNNLRQEDNTALYAAMGESVDVLNNATMPKLDEVFVITFTDGLRQLLPKYSSVLSSNDIQQIIDSNLVDSLPIQSYTVGFTEGMNAQIKQAFETDLEKLASTPDNFVSDDFDEISEYFSFISKQLVKVTEKQQLEKIPGPQDGTKVRWTFDIVEDQDLTASEIYIEGTVRRALDTAGVLSFC